MKRVTLYSSNRSPVTSHHAKAGDATAGADQAMEKSSTQAAEPAQRSRWRNLLARYERPLWVGAAGLLALLVVFTHALLMPTSRPITQEDIESAVLYTLDNKTLPSAAAKAYEVIRPSVVRVRRMEADEKGGEDKEKGVGTGVVIVDKGIILTNVHVVLGAKRVQVVFADGLESDATVTGMQPEND